MYRLPGAVVARVGGPGTEDTAAREAGVSEWLAATGFVGTEARPDVPQPTVVDDRPVTWWRLLPAHRPATPAELGSVLRALHALPVPAPVGLPMSDPFARLDQRINETPGHQVIHGDAWQDNVAVPASGVPILLDLEHVAIGRPDWDLRLLAVDYADFARLDEQDYRSFVRAYGGYDVMATPGFRVLAEIQELRWVWIVMSKSADSPDASEEARHRIACLRGDWPRPWSWTAF